MAAFVTYVVFGEDHAASPGAPLKVLNPMVAAFRIPFAGAS